MTSILVTGANGQLGKTIEELYSKTNMEFNFTFATKSELDIADVEMVKSVFNKKKFDYCINCAAYTNVDQAEKTPEIAYRVNAEGVKNLAEVCKQNNTILIHISTDYVFDGEKQEPYAVEDVPNPINEYGKSKLLGEKHIQNTLKKYFIIRTSWLYSKKYGKNFYKTILEKAETEPLLSITTKQTGCPTNTESLSKFIYRMIKIKSSNFGVYHFSDSKAMTWYDFASEILKEHNISTKMKLEKEDNYFTLARRPINSVLLNTKALDENK